MDTECSCYEDYDGSNNFFLNSSRYLDQELNDKILSKKETLRVPKIFYGTRTHKQIKQVVKEFGKTAYRHKRMTILSSRKYTCIQETNKNKDKLCNELLDPRLKVKECKYYNDHVKKRSTTFNNQMDTPWDIEDLISVGKEIGACPYFGARTLMANAEIIFCPYNYILNPEIRESMQIYLKGNIVILDEAHNVEDICREAATVMLRDDKIAIAIKECQHLLDKGCDPNIYTTIHKYLKDFIQFLQGVEVQENGFDKMISKAWYGIEFRVVLDLNNIGRRKFPVFLKASIEAIEDFKNNMKQDNPEKIKPTISQDTRKLLEYLYFAMQMIESDNYVNDYRIYVLETNEPTEVTEAQWFSSTVKKLTKVRTLTLRCMNPAIIFAPLAQDVRSVILASGTLTPTTSFQSELGTQFPYIINPNHIIPKNQIYIRCIAQGPKGKPLLAKYNTVNTWDFQDELGNLILQVCDAVPYGVLCFFSSYKVMNAIHDRWKNNYVWNRLSGLKRIFVEPKNDQELSPVMEAYRDVIKESSSKSYRTSCGAILFAVFRAKVAEGIDFSDNEARCVLGIGIPYLFLNSDVSMKMDYNNKSNESRSLLSGSEWYTVNAFRALNQAIGRCVRHKNDWGAVLLVDKRFEQKENVDYLPKWVKTNIKSNKNYDLEIELQDFVVMQVAREKGEKEKLMEN